jgi:hypothetical protein
MDADLQQLLRTILEQQPQGMAEHALLKALQRRGEGDFPDRLFDDTLVLFRAHFLLFHALYRLRERLLASGEGLLEIDPLCIRLRPLAQAAHQDLAGHDPLRDYYLDLGNLTATTVDDVTQMLGGFWSRFYARGHRAQALAVLGLEPEADLATAQRRYRQLAMACHPDRGGDAARFQAIQEAIAILRRC